MHWSVYVRGPAVRRKLAVASLLLVILGVVPSAEAAFKYRKALSVNGTQVVAGPGLLNYPVLVSIANDASLKTTANGGHVSSTFAYDIEFRAADGTTVLDWEVERYDGATGTLVAWVRFPGTAGPPDTRIQNGLNTSFFLYYGDPQVLCSRNNPRNVWIDNFRYVHHFGETTGDPRDSSPNAYDSGRNGTVTFNAVGQVGRADTFAGTDGANNPVTAYVQVGDGTLSANSGFSIAAWVYLNKLQTGRFVGLVLKGRDSGTDWVGIYKTDTNRVSFGWQCCAPPAKPGNLDGPVLATAQWYYVVASYDPATPRRSLYVNGVQVATDTGATYPDITQATRIGDDNQSGFFHDGRLDEVRFSALRTTAYIQTSYNNQSCASASTCGGTPFVVVGAEQASTTNYRSIGAAANYTTGSVTVALGSTTVDGAGTAWKTANRGRGDLITIGANTYTVLAVASDTRLVLTAGAVAAATASAYTIRRQFTTLQLWQSCINFTGACPATPIGNAAVATSNYVTDNRSEVGVAYRDGSSFAGPVSLTGQTTDELHTLTLTAEFGNRHNGLRGVGAELANGASATDALTIDDDYVTVEWLEVGGGSGTADGIHINTGGNIHNVIRNCLVHNVPRDGIRLVENLSRLDAYDNVIFANGGSGIRIQANPLAAGTRVRLSNNTLYGNTLWGIFAVAASNPTVLLQNNIAVSNTSGGYSVGGLDGASSNNLSSDATAAAASPAGGGVSGQTLANVKFVSTTAGSENLHIQAGSTAQNAAVNLSCSFVTDIDNDKRGGTWDIGADEITSGNVGCPAGLAPTGSNFVTNGDFSVLAGPGPGVLPAAGFTSGVANAGDGMRPYDTSFAIQTGTANYQGNLIEQGPFPGDPANAVPAANNWVYTNGNSTGSGYPHPPFKIWQQTVSGLTGSTSYVFYVYASNAFGPGWSLTVVPQVQFFKDGVQVGSTNPVPYETGTDVWTRFQTTFTTGAGQTSAVLSIWDAADDVGGDDLGITAIGLQSCAAPTAVELQDFTASARDSAVDLAWTTASELHNLGFNVYRATSPLGPRTKLTATLIPGLGASPTGASYSYRDSGLVNGVTYYYELEDVDTSGATKRHGPVSATPTADAGAGDPGGSQPGASSAPPPTRYGNPEGASLRIVERAPLSVVLELRTPGFFAVASADGTVELRVPGFEDRPTAGAPAVPVKRAYVDAVAGRGVRVAEIVPEDEVRFDGLRLSAAEAKRLEVTDEGVVMPGLARRRPGREFQELFPARLARLLETSFQGERKKARLELAPLRYDATAGTVFLARVLRVRLEFEGREAAETVGAGGGGRRVRPLGDDGGLPLADLVTRNAGLYAVRYEDVRGRTRGVPTSSLRLRHRNESVPYHLEPDDGFFRPGSILYFVSEGSASNSWGDAVYQLETGAPGLVMGTRAGSPSGPAVAEYVDSKEWEENLYYQPGLLEAPDPWLWDVLVSPSTRSYPFTLSQLSPGSSPARLEVRLQGASDFAANPDHHVRVAVNGQVVGEASWDGQTPQLVEAEVPRGILVEGTNSLSLENVGDTAATYSMVFLDKFSLSYPRLLRGEDGRLSGTFAVSGSAEVADIGGAFVVVMPSEDERASRRRVSWLKDVESTSSASRFRAETRDRYLVVAPEAVMTPTIRAPLPRRLRNTENRADWLLIAPAEFLAAAEPLVALRRSQGLEVVTASVEEVYEEFGFGEEGPQALKDFLEYAYQRWRRPSFRYALLLGDGTYDPKDYLGTGVKDRIPPNIVETSYLWTASDPGYASVNGEDLLPDVAIGRLPAATADEARALVDKVVSFETAGRTLEGRAVLVADNADHAGSFEADSDDLAATVLRQREIQRVYLSELGPGTRPTIAAAFDAGAGLVSYVGHGATAVWASENIFNDTDVARLQPQAAQPLLMTMNCLNGFFHFPPLDSLAEAFVKADGKGAVAAIAPSGLSVEEAAHLYQKALLTEIESGRHDRLGDAVLAAQEAYADSGAFPELLQVYHLFGDPALRIR